MNTAIVGQIAPGIPREANTARRAPVPDADVASSPRLRRLPSSPSVTSHAALTYNNAALPKAGAHTGTRIDTYA